MPGPDLGSAWVSGSYGKWWLCALILTGELTIREATSPAKFRDWRQKLSVKANRDH